MNRANHQEVNAVPEQWITADQAAEHLAISKRKLWLLVEHGDVPAYRLKGTRKVVRFKKSELDQIMNEGLTVKAT